MSHKTKTLSWKTLNCTIALRRIEKKKTPFDHLVLLPLCYVLSSLILSCGWYIKSLAAADLLPGNVHPLTPFTFLFEKPPEAIGREILCYIHLWLMSLVKQTVCGSECKRRERNKEIPRLMSLHCHVLAKVHKCTYLCACISKNSACLRTSIHWF